MLPSHVFEFNAFDTINSIEIFQTEDGFDACKLEAAISGVNSDSERMFSPTSPDSVVSTVNGSSGAPVVVEERFLDALECALHYCELSGGRFDITVGPALRLWDFKEGKVPDEEELGSAVRHVGYGRVHVDRRSGTVCLSDPEARIDLGGIAKGLIADRMKELMVEHGVLSGLINLGGNVLAIGPRPDKTPWTVGVRKPQRGVNDAASSLHEDDFVVAVGIVDQSVVTSGTYERSFVDEGGVLRHHIIDPRTGYPAKTDVASCTIIAASSAQADGLSTAPIVMGLEEAMVFLEGVPGIEAILIDLEGNLRFTSGLSH